jgi:hypothetical protein
MSEASQATGSFVGEREELRRLPKAEPNVELETELERAVETRLKKLASEPDSEAKILGEDERIPTGGSEHGPRFR